jgi:hypothetical protein
VVTDVFIITNTAAARKRMPFFLAGNTHLIEIVIWTCVPYCIGTLPCPKDIHKSRIYHDLGEYKIMILQQYPEKIFANPFSAPCSKV